jgi:Uma2 family endonuclease
VVQLSLAEFLARPETDPPEEYHEGLIVPRPPLAPRERWLRSDLATLLYGWARASRQGAVAAGVRCLLGGAVYVPDIVYFAPRPSGSPPAPAGGALREPPDLAVEVCPSAVDPQWFHARLEDFLARGVQAGWLIDPAEETVTVFGPGAARVRLARGAILESRALLPGFYVHLDDLFATLEEDEQESV